MQVQVWLWCGICASPWDCYHLAASGEFSSLRRSFRAPSTPQALPLHPLPDLLHSPQAPLTSLGACSRAPSPRQVLSACCLAFRCRCSASFRRFCCMDAYWAAEVLPLRPGLPAVVAGGAAASGAGADVLAGVSMPLHLGAPEPSEIWVRLVLGQATWTVHGVEQQVTSLLMW